MLSHVTVLLHTGCVIESELLQSKYLERIPRSQGTDNPVLDAMPKPVSKCSVQWINIEAVAPIKLQWCHVLNMAVFASISEACLHECS